MKTPFWPGCLRPPSIVAGVVLLRSDGSALLQLRDNKPGLNAAGQWVFPGGHCDEGESAEQGACREFEEETGYRCGRLHWLTTFCHPSDDLQYMYELSMFMSPYDGRQPVHCYEGQAVEFIARADLSRLPMPDYVRRVWDAAIEAFRAVPSENCASD